MSTRIVASSEFVIGELDSPGNIVECIDSQRDASVFVRDTVIEHMLHDSIQSFREGKETMGLLLGKPARSGDSIRTIVQGIYRLPVIASAHHVEVNHDSPLPLPQDVTEDASSCAFVVGWFHSHTGQGCFLSLTDARTHERWFRQPFAVSAVIDAADGKIAFFSKEGNRFVSAGYCIFREK